MLRRFVTFSLLAVLAAACAESRAATTYVCPPCPHVEGQTLRFEEDGECPVCGMELIEEPDTTDPGHADIHPGSGNFVVQGGPGHRDDPVTVFYHRPESFTRESPVLLVVPGSGRDADEYRDAWVEASERHGVLVLSPMYPEENYGFGDYHMGGLMEEINVEEAAEYAEHSHEVTLDEGRLSYRVNRSPEKWIFGDFDRIFELAAEAVGSTRDGYDLFGHSAGGQILHRLVLLRPGTRADRILAANSGFYTLPDLGSDLPFGLADAPVSEEDLRASFRERLVLFLGADDDHPESGGIFLRSPSADEQGPGRRQRGRHFWSEGRAAAEELGAEFNWEVEVVPGVGHDHEGMSAAAAEYLYGAVRDDQGSGSR